MHPTIFLFLMQGKVTSFFTGTLDKKGKIRPTAEYASAYSHVLRGKRLSGGKLYRLDGSPFAPWITVEARRLDTPPRVS